MTPIPTITPSARIEESVTEMLEHATASTALSDKLVREVRIIVISSYLVDIRYLVHCSFSFPFQLSAPMNVLDEANVV